jgi:hypothetical protein
VFLASDDASYITGTELFVGGGARTRALFLHPQLGWKRPRRFCFLVGALTQHSGVNASSAQIREFC